MSHNKRRIVTAGSTYGESSWKVRHWRIVIEGLSLGNRQRGIVIDREWKFEGPLNAGCGMIFCDRDLENLTKLVSNSVFSVTSYILVLRCTVAFQKNQIYYLYRNDTIMTELTPSSF